jgi:phage portal protein BeeE
VGMFWSLLTGRGLQEQVNQQRNSEKRLSFNDWAEMFAFGGNSYPIAGVMPSGGNSEPIGNDYTGYVQGAYKSSGIVYACIAARMLIFSEARFQYQRMAKGRPGDLFGTGELSILETPWPNGTTGELLSRALQDADLSGNHYVLREGAGPRARLRRLRPDWVDIILTAAPDEAVASDVAGYMYRPGGTDDRDRWMFYPIDGSLGTVVHWSPIPDPEAQYRGMSWLTPVIREIMADKAASAHKAKFFENAATPNLAVSLKESVTNEQFKEFMKTMESSHGGIDNAYKTLYLAGGADVTVIGANLQQMDFKSVQGHGEARVAMAARVHPTILGMADTLHGSGLNEGNLKAAKALLGDGCMRPLWRSIAAAYAPLVASFDNARLWYDDRDIAFLRQDRADIAKIQQVESQTISAYIQSGYTADSSRDAVMHGDIGLLQHTGLFSVQLMPPGTLAKQPAAAVPPPADGAAKPAPPPGKSSPSQKKPPPVAPAKGG